MLSFKRGIQSLRFNSFVRSAHTGASAYRKAPDVENSFADTGDSFSNITEKRVKEFEEKGETKVVSDRGLYENRTRTQETEDTDAAVKEVFERDNEIYRGKTQKKTLNDSPSNQAVS